MPKTTERDLVEEVEELLAKATPGPRTLIRYEHGGGRLYRDGDSRELVADFYSEGDRELYSRTDELLRRMVEEVKALRSDSAKLNQAMGWLSDAADAAYNEDPDNERIHEIFNIVAQATGITRRLPDEYQRFDESSTAWTEQ